MSWFSVPVCLNYKLIETLQNSKHIFYAKAKNVVYFPTNDRILLV
jgi:hypothetical protein